jgi:hypothetical protein
LLAALIALGATAAHAQRAFEQGELDALLAPIALYPDPLLSHVLTASQFPQDVMDAATWSRANPQLQGDAALRTVDGQAWHPSVKALIAYPEVLARIAESPQWLYDLGEAYSAYGPHVMATVQQLRARAQASGHLQSNQQQQVYQQGEVIIVQPAYAHIVYVPYYNPYVVYGGWWWPSYHPVLWRPWVARPCFVTQVVVAAPLRWHVFPHAVPARRVVQGPQVLPFRPVPEANRRPIINSAPTFINNVNNGSAHFARPVSEARRGPIINSAPAVINSANTGGAHLARPIPEARRGPIINSAPQMRSQAPIRTVAPQMHSNSFSHSVSHSAARGASGGGGHRGRGRG